MPRTTESAVANGDTRTLHLINNHVNEQGDFTYMVNGSYDMSVLEKLNWICRDWRLNEPTKMDPRLFDILWEVYRESGSHMPIDILSGYRSPQTNAMLRRRSRQVAEHSQHMEGRAMDAHFQDVGTATIRDITMRMQAGGVGFYPVGITPWVHIDSGTVRYWPRMSREALTRLFPDGKTVFIPADGQPMPGYELAKAEIEKRGGDVVTPTSNGFGLFSWLFGGPRGGGADDSEESGDSSVVLAGGGAVHGRGGGGGAAGGFTEVAMAPKPAPQTPEPQPVVAPPAVADVDAETPVSADVTLRGPVAAEFIAPLPPHKPQGLIDVALAEPPVPPSRPLEFLAPAPIAEKPAETTPLARATPANRDLILALIKRGRVPDIITRGLEKPLPHDALALTDPNVVEPPERVDLMRKAASLVAPLPPERPNDLRPAKPKNPYGALSGDAFKGTATN